jgi:hypothetical protein
MAMAALRHGARRLACQRRPAIFRAAASEEQRRLIHVGPPAVGRTFSLAEEQRRLSTRLIHGGRPAGGKTYARPFRSNHVSDARFSLDLELHLGSIYSVYGNRLSMIMKIQGDLGCLETN